ncbi:MAG: hypothetical protein QNK05_18950 [Myxococcota bacterium]|nr:hypothetical protein [Myxococcota bacterium]
MATSNWIDAERVFDKVVALSDDVIYVANPSSEQALAMKQALDGDEPASTVIKDDATSILINSILLVSYNAHDTDIDIAYQAGKEKESKNIDFSTAAERNDFALQLAERLPDFESKSVQYGRIRAALGPLAFGAVASLLTLAFYGAAIEIAGGATAEIEGRHRAIKNLVFMALDWIGPTGVLIVGGLLMFATGYTLVHRVHTPPLMHKLKRPKG